MNKSVRRHSPKGEARRRDILDAATRLFARGGFNTVSLADIAAEVGVTQAGLLHHFPSKSALFLGMLEQRDEMYEASQARRRDEGLGYFDSFLTTLKENEQNPDMVQLFTILSSEALIDDNPAKDWFAMRYDRIVTAATREIDQLVDPAKLPADVSVEDLARSVIGLADGLRLQWLMDPEGVDRTRIIAIFTAMLKPYMKAQEV